MNFIQLFNKYKDDLTKSEIKLANFIATHPERVIYDTTKSLSAATNTSDATIIRLCKKLGFSGFSNLKIFLAQESITQGQANQRIDHKKFYVDSANLLINSIKKTENLLVSENLLAAVKLLAQASEVYLFGIGHSGESALDFAKTWLRIGLIAHAEIDPHIQVQISSMLNKEDVVVGLSLSGHTKDTYDSLKLAKKNGAKIITISNDLGAPISKLGDVQLQTAVSEFSNIGSVAGQVSQLYLCEVLARGYEIHTNVDSRELKERVLADILKKEI
ncbi:MurR/RpiR family transcriptional regulator [Lactobacillus xylocopicola]|uniref:RpiR family transcriptional regulator n=1 Tax=Lactobacillus xylocopicola TaxID=2976676 RepID=A0ABM8BFZ9_9LACO|nr:MurR/RpiR family transcriptional regulator [Lactobacillus xylocopicola]BDR60181.1 RpiR family transcriptional regulator [Lactobacillus xylocopicola]